jgi:conjugative transfer pilus assembly protein TraH
MGALKPSKRLCSGIKSVIAAALSAALAITPVEQAAAGNIQAEIDAMYNSLGGTGNYTQPGAFRGQAYTTYTGGSLYLRTPPKVYQLATVQFPYVKAGCGGIDVFGGSFSHISAAEFKNMLKNITAALPGVAFQLALSSVSPQLGQVTEWATDLEHMITNARVNSCETAQTLVRGAANAMGFSMYSDCARQAIAQGIAADEDDARRHCLDPAQVYAILGSSRTSTDPVVKSMARFVGNLTWKALKNVTTVDDPEREIIMSVMGTVIYPQESDEATPIPIAPAMTSLKDLLFGIGDAGGGQVTGHLLKCNDFVDCTTVTDNTSAVYTPFPAKVRDMMLSIAYEIRNRTGPPSPAEIGFVNMVNEPVYQMLGVGTARKGSGLAEALIGQYADVIAIDFAYNFLDRYVRLGLTALAKDYQLDSQQQETIKEMRTRATELLAQMARERQDYRAKVASFDSIQTHLERLSRQERATMPQHVIDMVRQAVVLNSH